MPELTVIAGQTAHLLVLVEVDGASQGHDLEGALKDAAADHGEYGGDEQERHHHRARVALLDGQDADHEQLKHDERCDDMTKDLRPQLHTHTLFKLCSFCIMLTPLNNLQMSYALKLTGIVAVRDY